MFFLRFSLLLALSLLVLFVPLFPNGPSSGTHENTGFLASPLPLAHATSTFGITSTGSTSYPRAKTVTPGGGTGTPVIDTTQSVFGGASAKFVAANTQYLSLLDSDNWHFGLGAVTVDFQVRFASLPTSGNDMAIWAQRQDGSNLQYISLTYDGSDYRFHWQVTSGGSSIMNIRTVYDTVAINTWYDIEFARSGTTWYIFVNGASQSVSGTNAAIPNFAGPVYISTVNTVDSALDGWVDELAVLNGTALHTATYTIPTVPFVRTSTTVLLLHMDASGFVDDVTSGQMLFTKATLSNANATVSSFSFYSTSATGQFQVSLFNDSSGPASRLVYCPDTAVSSVGWQTVAIASCTPTSYTIASSGTYWPAVQWSFNSTHAYLAGPSYTAGAASTGAYLYQAYGTPPATASSFTLTTEEYSVYVTYTTSASVTLALSGVSNDAGGTIMVVDGTNYVYADFPKAFSWTTGSTHTVTATDPIVVTANQKRYSFLNWTNGDGLSSPSGTYTTPGSPITVTVNYAMQYDIIFATAEIGSDANAVNILTVNGTSYHQSAMPHSLWVNSGNALVYSWFSWTNGTLHNYSWVRTDGLSQTVRANTFTVTTTGTVTGTYTDVEPQPVSTPSAAYSIFVRNGVLYLFGSNKHLYKSTDGGITYTDLYTFTSRPGGDVAESMYVTKNDTIIVSVCAGVAPDYLYRSGDHGVTFTLVKTNATMFRDMTEDELGNLYYGTYGDSSFAPSSEHPWVYKSTNNGITWNIVLNETANSRRHIHDVTFDGTNIWVLVGEHVSPHIGSEVAYSSDHGTSWTYKTETDNFASISVTPTEVVLGSDVAQSYILVLDRPSLTTNKTINPTIHPLIDYYDSVSYLSGPPVYLVSICDDASPQSASVFRYNGTSLTPIMTTIAAQFSGYQDISKEQIGGYYFVIFSNSTMDYLFKFHDPGYESVTQLVTLTVSPVGATVGTLTLSGCNVNPTTILGDGSSHSVSADPSCSLTVTVPTDLATSRYRYGGGASTWQFNTCASGICSAQTKTYYQEYLLTINLNSYGTSTLVPSGNWYNASQVVQVTIGSDSSNSSTTRRLYNGATGAGSGSYTGSLNPFSVTMNAPITENIAWQIQYTLTTTLNGYGTSTPTSGTWENSGTSVPVTISSDGSNSSTTRHLISGIAGSGSGSYTGTNNPFTITMNAAITETVTWTTQYTITFTLNGYGVSNPATGTWENAGISIGCHINSDGTNTTSTRHLLNTITGAGAGSYTGSANPFIVTVNAPITESLAWTTQYNVTVTSSGIIAGDTSGTVVTVNGTAKTQAALPYSMWVTSGNVLNYAFSSPITGTLNTYTWSSTGGFAQTLQSNIFTVTTSGTLTGTYTSTPLGGGSIPIVLGQCWSWSSGAKAGKVCSAGSYYLGSAVVNNTHGVYFNFTGKANNATAMPSYQFKFAAWNTTNTGIIPVFVQSGSVSPTYVLNALNYSYVSTNTTLYTQLSNKTVTANFATGSLGAGIRIYYATAPITSVSFASPTLMFACNASGTFKISVPEVPAKTFKNSSEITLGNEWTYGAGLITVTSSTAATWQFVFGPYSSVNIGGTPPATPQPTQPQSVTLGSWLLTGGDVHLLAPISFFPPTPTIDISVPNPKTGLQHINLTYWITDNNTRTVFTDSKNVTVDKATLTETLFMHLPGPGTYHFYVEAQVGLTKAVPLEQTFTIAPFDYYRGMAVAYVAAGFAAFIVYRLYLKRKSAAF